MRRRRSSVWSLACAGALSGALAQPSMAAATDLYSECYRCFEALQIAGAGTAAGGRFTGIGELYFLPGIRHGRAGLYVVSAAMSRFEELPRIPRSSKEDYLLTVEIVSNHDYIFEIRHQDETAPHAGLGWSIAQYSQSFERPKWEKRLVVLLGGRDSTATDALRAEILRGIPRLADRFEDVPHEDVYPVVRLFARDFDMVTNVLRGCASSLAADDPELTAAAALEQVKLVRALDRADRFLVRGGEDRWKGALDDDLVVELCRLASCSDNESAAQVEAEARKLVEEISRLHDRIVSLHKTYGKDWEQPLLESLLREWHLDPSMAAALLERH